MAALHKHDQVKN